MTKSSLVVSLTVVLPVITACRTSVDEMLLGGVVYAQALAQTSAQNESHRLCWCDEELNKTG